MKRLIPHIVIAILLFGCASGVTQPQKDINIQNKVNYMDKQKVEQQKGIMGYWDDLINYINIASNLTGKSFMGSPVFYDLNS